MVSTFSEIRLKLRYPFFSTCQILTNLKTKRHPTTPWSHLGPNNCDHHIPLLQTWNNKEVNKITLVTPELAEVKNKIVTYSMLGHIGILQLALHPIHQF